jgi:hypothetical protein
VQQYLTLWDLVLTPLYLVALIAIATRMRNNYYPKAHPLRPYFLPGLYLKIGGAIFIALIYQYYYKGAGDTFRYFDCGNILNSSLSDSFTLWLKLLTRVSPDADPFIYKYSSAIEFYTDPPSFMVVRITALLGLITFNSYLPTAILFAVISYSGIWAMYRTFCQSYPHRIKQLAIAFLFVPSVFVWGSSIFKDTVCMFGLGWMVFTSFRIFVNKDMGVQNMTLLFLSFALVAIVKVYILLAFLPSLMLWLLLTYAHRIRSMAIRVMLGASVLALVSTSFLYLANTFSDSLNQYSLSSISATVETTRDWITYSSGDEGATYDLGEFEPTLWGMAKIFPAGVTVTLFRPFLWEIRKPIQLLSGLESFVFIVLTIATFIKNGIGFTFRKVFSDPNLIFFLTFSLIFAFAVGISTGNFGSLSRYKIPCLPFFAALLVILYYTRQKESNVNPAPPTNKAVANSPSYSH